MDEASRVTLVQVPRMLIGGVPVRVNYYQVATQDTQDYCEDEKEVAGC